jgi:hypothetical protein
VGKVEQKLLGVIERRIVLSEKDQAILREMEFCGEIEPRPPSRVRIGEVSSARPVSQILGFLQDEWTKLPVVRYADIPELVCRILSNPD